MEKILIGGYFGFGNIGDEAILLSEIEFLKKEGYKVIILTKRGIKLFNEECINRYNFFKIFKIRKEFKYFILGGGGIFQDKTSLRSLLYYIFLIFFMKFLKKRVILLNVGIGPIKRKISKNLLSISLKKSDLIIFRDKYSYEYFNDLKNKFLSTDSSFTFSYTKRDSIDKILISLRKFDLLNLEKFKKFIQILKDKLKKNLEFIVFSRDEIELAKYLNLKYFYSDNPLDILDYIGKCNFLIGTRYHSIIFSIITNTPFVGLIYDIKVLNLIKEIGVYTFLDPLEDVDIWVKKFFYIYEKKEEFSKFLFEKKFLFKERLEKGLNILRNFLKNGSI